MTQPREGLHRRWRLVWIVCAASAGVTACGLGPSPKQETTRPTVAATAPIPSPAALSVWQKRGATEVPPPDLRQVSMEGIEVVDQAGQAISEADAESWAAALLRAINYEYWAVNRLQDGFLLQSGLSSAPRVVFLPDLADISAARKANQRVQYTRKAIRRMVLRPVPDTLRATFDAQFSTWEPYAFYLDAVGPSTKVVIDASGKQTTQTMFPPGAPAPELIGGSLVHDPLMGNVFAFGSDWDCIDTANRQHLAPLCNP